MGYTFLLDADGNSPSDDSFSTISVDEQNSNEDSNDSLSFNLQESLMNANQVDDAQSDRLLQQSLCIGLQSSMKQDDLSEINNSFPLPDQKDKSLPSFHLAFPNHVHRNAFCLPYHKAMAPFHLDSFLLDSTVSSQTIFDFDQLTFMN